MKRIPTKRMAPPMIVGSTKRKSKPKTANISSSEKTGTDVHISHSLRSRKTEEACSRRPKDRGQMGVYRAAELFLLKPDSSRLIWSHGPFTRTLRVLDLTVG